MKSASSVTPRLPRPKIPIPSMHSQHDSILSHHDVPPPPPLRAAAARLAEEENLWVIETEAEDEDDLDKATEFDITNGEWEPPVARVRRQATKILQVARRIF